MKLFKELTGKSFSQYVIDYRLEIAAGQLIETSDKIIDHENSWRTKTEYRNGNSYRREVPVRIDLHEKHFKCDNCGNEEVRYIREEHDL